MKAILRSIAVLGAAYACGALLERLHFPLPWLVGAMLAAVVMRLSGLKALVPAWTRPLGQITVASSIGMMFTPAAVLELQSLLWPIVLAALGTIAVGLGCAWVLSRLSGLDIVSAGLASVPIGPVESATLAAKLHRDPGPIIFAQTLRIMLIVVIIPAVIIGSSGLSNTATVTLKQVNWTWGGAVLLLLCGVVGAFLARKVHLSNPYFLGPLAMTSLAASVALPVSPIPYAALVSAQIFLGVWLGAAFDPSLLSRGRRMIAVMVVSNLLLLVLCAAMAFGVSWVTGVDWHITVLGTAPGSVTEMALSAKILGEGVTTVIAFHIVRVFIVMPAAPWIFRVMAARRGDR